MEIGEIISTVGLLVPATVAAGGWLWQRWQERTSVRVAIVAEVLALRKIAEERNYLSGLFEMAEALRGIPEEQRPPASLQVRIPEHYCRVYLANLGKLGYLSPEDAQLVVSFYQYIDSVVQDVTAGGILYEGTNDPDAFSEAANILKFALDASKKLADRHAKC
ncbi:hypothetical protein [Pseudomonas fontis]|uniref:Uncharacterized protein n=1 Tax=Pseudomonas fontis TaxID=2942633 RepID=A0ABT5NQI6_9PSED|nr:hypothetical protein [Pseudomonas fontis]MDD0974658.1 hypothetical protein [Pseudomonas fontis]MDD0990399.1 hypothetical protein [Pseudomonas fontis]